ncbi:MAG: ribosome maturation factor RimM [Halobacteriovoraceae bacterium]|nr:ribosome maturation factor RimM [Halobacteriovoraceae bacterium]
MKKNLIKLGECRKPHGIKGAFSFHLINKDSSVLKAGMNLSLKPLSSESSLKPEGESFEISSISFGNKTICYLKEVENRNRVEEILPFEIFVDRDGLPEVKEGEFYLSDLIGCLVFDESGAEVGKVVSLDTNGVQDILNIDGRDGVLEVLLVENFVKEIDIENEKIVISRPELI